MKEAFIKNRFSQKSKGILAKIDTIMEEYAEEGYDVSLRQLFYLLAGHGRIPKTEKSYKNLGNLVSNARLAGVIDWDMIKDRGRGAIHASHSESIPDIVGQMKYGFKVDMWARQPAYVEVFVEKQSLEGILEPVCWDLDVPFSSNKGYSSSSAYYAASKRYLAAAEAGKKLHVIYLGDHDPSGLDMSEDIDSRFTRFIQTVIDGTIFSDEEIAAVDPRPHELHRIALNMNQVMEMRLQSSPAKVKDPRLGEYVRRFKTQDTWELAAIEPRVLASLVRDKINGLVDREMWDEDFARQQKGRGDLQDFADSYGKEPTENDEDLLDELQAMRNALEECELKKREILYLPKIKKAVKQKKGKEPKRPDWEI